MTLPLTNALLLLNAIQERAMSYDEAKVIAFLGESGIGKTQAAFYCAANASAVVVRPIVYKESALIALILEKMGLYDRATGRYATGRKDMSVQDRILLAADSLRDSQIPLIVDEAGSLGDSQLSMLRRLADISGSVVVLIGETGTRSRRCDDLAIKLSGIYNLQRRCEIVTCSTIDKDDVHELSKSMNIDLTDEMASYVATSCKTPSVAIRMLKRILENQGLGINVSTAMIDQLTGEIR